MDRVAAPLWRLAKSTGAWWCWAWRARPSPPLPRGAAAAKGGGGCGAGRWSWGGGARVMACGRASDPRLPRAGKAAWIAGTTFLVLVVPLIIEMDREQQVRDGGSDARGRRGVGAQIV